MIFHGELGVGVATMGLPPSLFGEATVAVPPQSKSKVHLLGPALAPERTRVYAAVIQERSRAMAFYAFDEEYVRRLKDGDRETETHFVEYFSGLLLAKLRNRLRHPQEAEDLRQEVFLRVLRSLRGGAIEQPERLGAFVLSVCNFVLMEHLRGGARTSQLDEHTPEQHQREADPEINLVTAETRRQVRTLLNNLPAQDQGILRALFYDEQDKDAVCRDYGVGRDYLRVLLHRAKRRLREAVLGNESLTAPAGGKRPRHLHVDHADKELP
ncbi:MAG TPA: sigma-70 family RNA polymerase sigma factor [Bryobacteraceae bacterium]|nr:sigma-70 family RNA polymerase sigma factor [Bryobacteraceae bacterium]